MEQLKSCAHHGGLMRRFRHASTCTGTPMTFSVFIPPAALGGAKVPAIYFLAGLECTDETFAMKAGAFAHAARAGVAMICPDTSPRGAGVAGESESWDFGVGAGFYVDATAPPWSSNWRMYSYVTAELLLLVSAHLPIDTSRTSIMGHSMGGLGALLCALRNPGMFKAVTAFAPISNPSEVSLLISAVG
jgi:S-formylglutathione hydrolase